MSGAATLLQNGLGKDVWQYNHQLPTSGYVGERPSRVVSLVEKTSRTGFCRFSDQWNTAWVMVIMAVVVFLSGVRDLCAAAALPGSAWPWVVEERR